MKLSQTEALLVYLLNEQKGITQLEAFNTLGCCRLSERVRELEARGYLIDHHRERVPSGKWVMRYKLIREQAAA